MPARMMLVRALLVLPLLTCAGPRCSAADAVGSADPAAKARAEIPRPRIDEVALRYYASLKQTARVEAETRRLRRLYPDWQPPSDLWTLKPGGADDAQLWGLFAADRLDDLRQAIDAHRAMDINWAPSSDLEQKLRRKELRLGIMASARSKRWNDVVLAAGNWRSDVAVEDVELLWLIAEGFARFRRSSDALQVFDTILRTASGTGERIATIQNALALLSMNNVDGLLQRGRADAAGVNEFDVIAIDVTRARISAVLKDMPTRDVSPAEFAKFQEFALSAQDPNQAALLGWYALKRSDTLEALDRFKSAIAKGGDATAALGLALTLKRLGRLRDAEEVAFAWRESLPATMSLYIDVVAQELTLRAAVDPKRLARYAEVTLQTTSGEAAQALGWYAYNACQTEVASEWLRRAVSWLPKETTAFGYALTLQRLKRSREFVEVVNRYDGLFPSVVELMFPDAQRASDDPCSASPARTDGSPEHRGAESNAVERRALPPARSAILRQAGWSPVPMPDRIVAGDRQRTALSRKDFPVAVAPENPYQSITGGKAGVKSPAGSWRPSDVVAPITEARRVPGVTAMPYERFGRTVLPGWNRIEQASLLPNAMLRAPPGTRSATDQALIDTQRQPAAIPSDSSEAGNAIDANRFHP